MLKNFIETVGWLSGLIAIIAAALSVAWFVFSLQGRVETLEKQMQALYQSAIPTTQSSQNNSGYSVASTLDSDNPNKNEQLSKLVDTCVELTIRVADSYKSSSYVVVAEPLQKMMKDLGCNKLVP